MRLRRVLISLPGMFVIVAAATSVGCSDPPSSPGGATRDSQAARSNQNRYEVTATDIAPYGVLLKAHEQGEQRALRIKVDTARNRLWVLGLNRP